MEKIKELSYGSFTTEVMVAPEVKSFLGFEIHVLDFNSDEWYRGWLLTYLDKDKDGVPDEEFGKNFELIYCGIIENPEDYLDIDDLCEDLNIKKEQVIFDGSKTVSKIADKQKFWIRWLVKKKD